MVLLKTLVDHLPWQSAYCKEDEVVEIENELCSFTWLICSYSKCVHFIDWVKKRYSVT